jgi:hypothetical protein
MSDHYQPGLFDLRESEKSEFLKQIGDLIDRKLQAFAREHLIGQQLLYSKKQAARLLGISPASIGRLVAQGLLKARALGGRRLYAHEELLKLLKRELPASISQPSKAPAAPKLLRRAG